MTSPRPSRPANAQSFGAVMDIDTAIPNRLLRKLVDVIDNAGQCPSEDVPPRSLVRDLALLVPGLWCSFGEFDYVTQQGLSFQSSDEDDYPPGYDADAAIGIEPGITTKLRNQHTTCHHMDTTRRTELEQFSDFITVRQWHARELYQDAFRYYGIDHIMVVPLPAAPGRSRAFQFHRGPGSGFSETERAMLLLLQPHLHQIYKQAAARQRVPVGLTVRQLDVLRCVALGMSNDQIANQLVIAPGTVTKHLENIYTRLGVTSRTAAVARVFNETGLHA